MGARRRGREFALQTLYAMDMNPDMEGSPEQPLLEDGRVDYEAADFAEVLVRGVMAHQAIIDGKIKEKSKNWAISRMAKVDLNILRLAAYELLFCADIPKNVTINEAVEVAKKYGTEDTPAFVNGILDEIAATLPDKNNKA